MEFEEAMAALVDAQRAARERARPRYSYRWFLIQDAQHRTTTLPPGWRVVPGTLSSEGDWLLAEKLEGDDA